MLLIGFRQSCIIFPFGILLDSVFYFLPGDILSIVKSVIFSDSVVEVYYNSNYYFKSKTSELTIGLMMADLTFARTSSRRKYNFHARRTADELTNSKRSRLMTIYNCSKICWEHS